MEQTYRFEDHNPATPEGMAALQRALGNLPKRPNLVVISLDEDGIAADGICALNSPQQAVIALTALRLALRRLATGAGEVPGTVEARMQAIELRSQVAYEQAVAELDNGVSGGSPT